MVNMFLFVFIFEFVFYRNKGIWFMFVQKLDILWIRLCDKVKKNIIDVFDDVLLKIESFFSKVHLQRQFVLMI